MLDMFIDVLSDCISQAYNSVKPSDGIGRLLETIRDCLISRVSQATALRNNVSIHEIQGKVFAQIDPSPYMQYKVTREVADIILMIEHGSRTSLVFMQLENSAMDLNAIERMGRDFEKVIGHFVPRSGNTMYANKGQLLVLSGFFERILYQQHRGGFDNLCNDTFIACNELPLIRYNRSDYLYGGGQRIPTGNSRMIERVRRSLMLYLFSIVYNNKLYVLVERSSDLMYLVARPGYVPYRLATIEQNIWNNIQAFNLSSTINDISTAIRYFNEEGVKWKVGGITRFRLNRSVRDQLELILRERDLINFTSELPALLLTLHSYPDLEYIELQVPYLFLSDAFSQEHVDYRLSSRHRHQSLRTFP